MNATLSRASVRLVILVIERWFIRVAQEVAGARGPCSDEIPSLGSQSSISGLYSGLYIRTVSPNWGAPDCGRGEQRCCC